jgi:hypothetical protein
MSPNNSIKCSEISDGQYTVKIDLGNFQNKMELSEIRKHLKLISKDCDDDISGIYRLDGNKLVYRSESLFPMEGRGNKPNVFIVFGNPAYYSVKYRMFFFSRNKNQRHGMWGKLQKANLIKPVRFSDDDLFFARKLEAEERKRLISAGQASEKYSLGLTTFYSFPTPVVGKFRDVQGVEKIFRPILEDIIIPFEVDRILKYSFTQDAILVFVQKSSYEAFMRHSDREALFWPVRGKNSSGEGLSQLLKEKISGKSV